jgi:inner membrane protein
MDSLTQLVLGAAIGVAVMGRRTAVWKAAVWGGVAGTLPDLDVIISHGDAVRDMTYHRAETHALFYLSLASLPLAWLASRGEREHFKHWWLALWLALVTHPLLDAFTIYGTQLFKPFSDYPVGLGSMFIIDPLYTVPLIIGLVAALRMRQFAGLRWNALALGFSCLYLAWSVAVQWHVQNVARQSLAERGMRDASLFATPSPFNTVLWRVVVRTPSGYEEGFYSLLDRERRIKFDAFPSDAAVYQATKDLWAVQRMAWFTKGFFNMHEENGQAVLTDLRMGQEPRYVFSFLVAKRGSAWQEVPSENVGGRLDPARTLAWLWPRMLGQDIAPPR